MDFDGFISYSHVADGELAPALQTGLQRLARPWYRLRALHVFRDESTLSTSPHLWGAIERALDESEWLVLLASPASASSEWVNRELAHWIATKPIDRILPVVTDGTWEWDASKKRLSDNSTAAPDMLRGVFADEPRHLDLRWARDRASLDLRDSQFRGAVADIASPLHGVAKDELESEDVRLHRSARRLARSGVAALAALLIVALITTGLAIRQKHRADDAAARARNQTVIAQAERLAAVATANAASQQDLAMLLAAEGFHLHDDTATRRALLATLTANRGARQLRSIRNLPSGIIAGAIAPDLSRAVFALGDGHVHFVETKNVRDVVPPIKLDRPFYSAVFSPDSKLLATDDASGEIDLWNPITGTRVAPKIQGGPTVPAALLGVLAFSPDHSMLAAAAADQNALNIFSTISGDLLAPPIPITGPVDVMFSKSGNSIVAGGAGEVVVVNSATKQVVKRLKAGTNQVTAVALSYDGRFAMSGDDHGVVRRWDVTGSVVAKVVQAHGEAILDLIASPQTQRFWSSSGDRRIRQWDTSSLTPIGQPLTGFRDSPRGLLFANDGSLLTLAALEVTQWDIGGRNLFRTIPNFEITSDGAFIVGRDPQHRHMSVVDSSATASQLPVTATQDVLGAGVAIGGHYAYSVQADDGRAGARTLRTYELPSGRVARTVTIPDGLEVVDLAPDGNRALLNGAVLDAVGPNAGCCVVLWDLTHPHDTPSGWDPTIMPFGAFHGQFEPTGTVVVFGAHGPNEATAARFSSSKALQVFHDPFGIPESNSEAFAVGKGQRIAVSTSNDIQVLNSSNLKPVGDVLFGPKVTHMAFSPDDTLLATAGGSTVVVWDLASGQELTRFEVGDSVTHVGFVGADATRLVYGTAVESGVVDLNVTHWLALACKLAGRQLTPREWKSNVGEIPFAPTCRSAS